MKQFSLLMVCLFAFCAGTKAQEERPAQWTLRSCLDYALENNIQVKTSKVSHLSGLEDTKQAKAQLFPSLSANVTQGFTNYPSDDASTKNTYTGNYGLNASWTLFDGGQRYQALKQQKIQNTVDELSIEESENDIRVSIVQAYMQVLYAMEAIRINENTVEVSTAQRDRAMQLLSAGSISRVDLSQLESQLSTDKYNLVAAQNNLANYKLQLKQLLELDIMDDIDVVMPNISEDEILSPLPDKEVIYATSLSVMPEIKGSQLSVEMAELYKKQTKGAFFPTIALSASASTGHSSMSGYSLGSGFSLSSSNLWDNFNESIGLTISIPIFSNRQYKTAYNKAKYAITTSQLQLQSAEKQLLQTVENYYLEATSSQSEYVSATDNLSYVKESYELVDEQFSVGMKNTVELLTEKNNYLTAQQQQLQAKYMALMNIQLLNIYQNKPVSANY